MPYSFIYPLVRVNPDYKFNEVLSGYNYNFTLLETALNSGTTNASNGLSFISGQTIGLGGNLTQNTHISNNNYLFSLDSLSGSSISANTISLTSLSNVTGLTNYLVIQNDGSIAIQNFSGESEVTLDGGSW